jgi:glutaredoxin 3
MPESQMPEKQVPEKQVPGIEIYSSMLCGFCARAKRLLEAKGAEFEEIDIMLQPGRRREMIERAGGRTSVPQIFIDGQHIGGCDELYALEQRGNLDPLLTKAP